MLTNDRSKQFHDTATGSMLLSAAEQAQREAQYAEQDQQERALLRPTGSSDRLVTLYAQVETALLQLLTVTQHMQPWTTFHETVQREIAVSVLPGDQL
jgi:hypothetical protein